MVELAFDAEASTSEKRKAKAPRIVKAPKLVEPNLAPLAWLAKHSVSPFSVLGDGVLMEFNGPLTIQLAGPLSDLLVSGAVISTAKLLRVIKRLPPQQWACSIVDKAIQFDSEALSDTIPIEQWVGKDGPKRPNLICSLSHEQNDALFCSIQQCSHISSPISLSNGLAVAFDEKILIQSFHGVLTPEVAIPAFVVKPLAALGSIEHFDVFDNGECEIGSGVGSVRFSLLMGRTFPAIAYHNDGFDLGGETIKGVITERLFKAVKLLGNGLIKLISPDRVITEGTEITLKGEVPFDAEVMGSSLMTLQCLVGADWFIGNGRMVLVKGGSRAVFKLAEEVNQ